MSSANGDRGPLLDVRNLSVEFPTSDGWVRAVDDVSLTVYPGEVVGLVGESGSGKTVTSLAVLGLTREIGGRIPVESQVLFEGNDLTKLSSRQLGDIRGKRIGMIFQQPVRSLDPAFSIGGQIAETIRRHEGGSKREAWAKAITLLDRVKIPDAAKRAKQYPHEFSGGMCQRVMMAMALSCSPSLLIADEPTTALDVTVQSHVLELLREIQADTGVAILFISHDLGVIAEMCDAVAVMYAGQIVERATAEDLFLRPRHPYTSGLMGAVPKVGMGKTLVAIPGNVPDPGRGPAGCRFHPRCPHAVGGVCDGLVPPLAPARDGRVTRCARADDLSLTGVVVPT
jgi:peptide/nickel transport system ATP-binding protein